MAEEEKLSASVREQSGTRAAKRLRRQGKVPGVIYGHGQETVPLAVGAEELASIVRHGVRVVDVEFNGNAEKALIRELQWDTFGQDILHFDLTRVSKGERIEIQVRIELRGTPRGVKEGGVVEQALHELTIECPATEVPSEIRLNVNDLGLGESLHVSDLPLPGGVKALAEPEAMVVHVTAPAEVEEEVAEAAAAAEPELIGREEEAGEEAASSES
jgi:large subunit ribosomal protein L25